MSKDLKGETKGGKKLTFEEWIEEQFNIAYMNLMEYYVDTFGFDDWYEYKKQLERHYIHRDKINRYK